jgi:hypothetical protein
MVGDQAEKRRGLRISGMINTCGREVHTLPNGRATVFAKVSS